VHTPGGGHGSSPLEKRFAPRLAVLEKAESWLRKLDFVWATVVLLGAASRTRSGSWTYSAPGARVQPQP
jgi:hypothetical protein